LPPRTAARASLEAKPPPLRRFSILGETPGPADRVAPDEALIVCPWLRGLALPDGLFLSALPIHDVNAFFDGGWSFDIPLRLGRRSYVGVFALDRLRLAEQLLGRLREKGVANIINLPAVSFFDGATARTFATLGFTPEAELAFLRQARRAGFRVAYCARTGAAILPDMIGGLDFILRHDGPGRPFALEGPFDNGAPIS
jgi:predicted TIM-barrel enzyme